MLRTYNGPPGTATTNDTWEEIMDDKINHPSHYTQGIECWDYITSHNMGYLEGNIIKYITRFKAKGGREDLLKARAYLEKLLDETALDPDVSWPSPEDCSKPYTLEDYVAERRQEMVRETQEAMRDAWNDPEDWRTAPLKKPCLCGDDLG